MKLLAIDGSPTGNGRTSAAVRAVQAGPGATRIETERELVSLSDGERGLHRALSALGQADAIVIGSPVYRASFAHPLKILLDQVPRGMWGEPEAPLQGRAVAIVVTGASLHHFLALDSLRNVLTGFFAAHVVPPGLYVPHEGFDKSGGLTTEYAERAHEQGQALVELATMLEESTLLRHLGPQA